MNSMTKEDSYAERRQLFKNIWETAMQIDDKDADNIMNKPKVIKCFIGKRKKEKIRTLRTVCKKILDFCDEQDEDDRFFEQIAEKNELRLHKLKLKHKKTHRGRKKVKTPQSLFAPLKSISDLAKPTTSEKKDGYSRQISEPNTTRKDSPIKTKRPLIVRRALVKHKISRVKSAITEGNNAVTSRRKTVKRRRTKRKKPSVGGTVAPSKPSGTSTNMRYASTPSKGHAIVRRIKQLLTDHKIAVT
ncbi:hypothetical protein HF086_017102 [Spodoptera exigua]|uniref:Uncharacterized protein n=1 Tax=Spodoptera exigua TaxID=7107 RepID=A0A922MRX9_SPOEX|nr:hypothetical protein HF086_017102 [Spodoptera exigua]